LEKLKYLLNPVKLKTSRPFFNFFYRKFIFRKKSVFFRLIFFFLLPLSLIYFFVITLRKIFTKKESFNFFLTSVGNITTGGTGKTLLVYELIKKFLNSKYKIALVSSVYKKDKISPWDEVMMLKNNFPSLIISSEKNPEGLKKLEEKGVEIVIIDDGFHCYWAKKDIEILMIDCSNPFDNGFLIPAGLLRESISSINRVDIFVLSYSHLVEENKKENLIDFFKRKRKPVFLLEIKPLYISNRKNELSIKTIKNKRVFCFAGIGNPLNFFVTVLKLEPEKLYSAIYPDHYNYRKEDIEEIINFLKNNRIELAITTEKDFVKIEKFLNNEMPVYFLKIKGEIEPSYYFDRLLEDNIKLKRMNR